MAVSPCPRFNLILARTQFDIFPDENRVALVDPSALHIKERIEQPMRMPVEI